MEFFSSSRLRYKTRGTAALLQTEQADVDGARDHSNSVLPAGVTAPGHYYPRSYFPAEPVCRVAYALQNYDACCNVDGLL